MQSTIRNQELNNEWRVRHRSHFSINFAHGCLGLRFTLTHLINDKITCAITNTARMPPTDIIHVAMWICVTLLVCDGCVKCVFLYAHLEPLLKKIKMYLTTLHRMVSYSSREDNSLQNCFISLSLSYRNTLFIKE